MNLVDWQRIKNLVKPIYYWFFYRYFYILERLFPPKNSDPYQIPIIINNFNRVTYLRRLIDALEKRGYSNIFIIDNASTYPPLLEFYRDCSYKVFHLKKNVGYLALWKTNIYKYFRREYFVYTDSDVVPAQECPDDFMKVFLETLKKYKFARKVGFSLKIDNIPDSYDMKEEVLSWESQFYKRRISELLYRAPIDTTFALYRPRAKGGSNAYTLMYRTAAPYVAEHLPWYINSKIISEEDKYYNEQTRTSTMWTIKTKESL